MKTLYFECNMGAAGDMLLSALTDLMADDATNDGIITKDTFIEQLNNAGIPNVRYTLTRNQKCGIYGTKVVVTVNGSEEVSLDVNESNHDHHHDCGCEHTHGHLHSHSSLDYISDVIEKLKLPSMVKMNAIAVYNLIAEAESVAHNCNIKNIHFHEVGTADAIADIVGVCLAIYRLKPNQILCSPIHVGSGQVKCAHGILPVPAPATAYILKNVPIYSGSIKGELCTPTGAALLKYFSEKYCSLPVMTVNKTGIGCGTKDFEQANVIRVMYGDLCIDANIMNTDTQNTTPDVSSDLKDMICELSCNIDDMTGEDIAYATEVLIREGALDVYTINIGMKKNRPGIMINCICKLEDKERFVKLIFKYTTTLGIREKSMDRYILKREIKDISTEYGNIKIKHSFGYDTDIEKMEYADIEKISNSIGEKPEAVKKSIIKRYL